MPTSLRYIVVLSLAIGTVLCATELQPSKEERLRQELERIRQRVQELERTLREMWRQ